MERIVVWYLRMGVIYFVLGAMLGTTMLLRPDESGYFLFAHVHLNLLGFMSMMIYGVGYHILPRFSGRTIYSPLLVRIQFWAANAGLAGMAISWPLIAGDKFTFFFSQLLVVSAFCSLTAVILFAVNMLKTIKPA